MDPKLEKSKGVLGSKAVFLKQKLKMLRFYSNTWKSFGSNLNLYMFHEITVLYSYCTRCKVPNFAPTNNKNRFLPQKGPSNFIKCQICMSIFSKISLPTTHGAPRQSHIPPKVSCCGLAPGCGGWFNQLGSSDSVWSGWDFVGILRGIFWRGRYIHAVNFVETNEGNIFDWVGSLKLPIFFGGANFRLFQHIVGGKFWGVLFLLF